MSLTINTAVKLSSGASIPQLGFGVFRAEPKDCEAAVKEALRVGYRHIDSAQFYHNEEDVGRTVKESGLKRSEVFITTKYLPEQTPTPPSKVYDSIRSSLGKIDQLSSDDDKKYIDLLLVHAAFGGPEGRANNWEALVKAQKEGWVKDIGVSNFDVPHLKALPGPKPAVNQVELHPFCQQKEIAEYCKENGIIVQAYSPLFQGDKSGLENPVMVKIAKKHGKDVSHVALRWSLQKGFVPLPKSVTPSRIASNADLYDFELSQEDMDEIATLDKGMAGTIAWNPISIP
ncbi:hypothetical protein CI109_101027 [Kwoniella shandongensis]|uniref:Uncharacterized protein n=1 Tax=Kwoniella shandongensis TaxID=1734106 RepID=A0A5M6C8K1_9TREE|nr:uncharacterized protein CI109_001496 [Kwoniella shandongensis]KAA5530092.1 hypothetical protein CI109_001496 [Kwoniella shandongensis]